MRRCRVSPSRGRGFRAADRVGDAGGQAVAAADHGEAHAVAHQSFDLVGKIKPQQRHQRGHFRLRPAPIVAGERIQRQRADALLRRRLHHAADRLDAGLVAAQPRQPLPDRPASIAVHDDADMQFGLQFGWKTALHRKVSLQKKGEASDRQDAKPGGGRVAPARGRSSRGSCGIAHQPFQHGEIIEETAAAGPGQPAGSVRPVALIALCHFDQACFLQHARDDG